MDAPGIPEVRVAIEQARCRLDRVRLESLQRPIVAVASGCKNLQSRAGQHRALRL
jgi:hypothetical protein